jgi:hypothetical protein
MQSTNEMKIPSKYESINQIIRNPNGQPNEHIQAGRYSMSIQFSANHYCKPRQTDLPAYLYSEMEVMVITRLPSDLESIYNEYLDGIYNDYTLLAYLPVAKVEELYQTLKSME